MKRMLAYVLVAAGIVAAYLALSRAVSREDARAPAQARTTSAAESLPEVAAAAPENDLVVEEPEREASLWQQLFPEGDPAWAWAEVDLDALRDEIPDNSFWEYAAPTDDLRVQDARGRRRERINRDLGKVLSNTATEQEVIDFYSERARVSQDYVEFITLLLDRHGDVLPPRDVGLLGLARNMHRTRLEELPRRVAEALARRDAHARVREQWLADEAAFAEPDPTPDP